jgi:hypothetical protein
MPANAPIRKPGTPRGRVSFARPGVTPVHRRLVVLFYLMAPNFFNVSVNSF